MTRIQWTVAILVATTLVSIPGRMDAQSAADSSNPTIDVFIRMSYDDQADLVLDKAYALIDALRSEAFTAGQHVGQTKPPTVLRADAEVADFIADLLVVDASTGDHAGGIENFVYLAMAIHHDHPQDRLNKALDFFIKTEWKHHVEARSRTAN